MKFWDPHEILHEIVPTYLFILHISQLAYFTERKWNADMSRELHSAQTPDKYQHVAEGPVDSTDTNIVGTSTSLKTTQRETANFTVFQPRP